MFIALGTSAKPPMKKDRGNQPHCIGQRIKPEQRRPQGEREPQHHSDADGDQLQSLRRLRVAQTRQFKQRRARARFCGGRVRCRRARL